MAHERDDGFGGDPAEASHGPQECMPCRGAGALISNLGGESKRVQCPWCEGDGERKPGIDAQARWSAQESAGAPAAGEAA